MKMFPIMTGRDTKGPCPSRIPWDAIAPYEGQAQENHSQSLERLAERGGLDPIEAFFVMTGRSWLNVQTPVSDDLEKQACAFLEQLVRDRGELQVAHDRYKAALVTIALHAPASHPSVNSYGELSGSRDCYSCARKVDMAKAALESDEARVTE